MVTSVSTSRSGCVRVWPPPGAPRVVHEGLTATRAQSVIAAAILRRLHAVITTGQAGTATSPPVAADESKGPSRPDQVVEANKLTVGASPTRHEEHRYLAGDHGQPCPSSHPHYTQLGTSQ